MMGLVGPAVASFSEILAERARQAPDALAFTFLRDGETDEETITNRELHEHALAIATQLRETVPAGARVLLLFPPGCDYVAAIFGCFHAGVVGVSATPPQLRRLERTLGRLMAIAADAEIDAVLAAAPILDAADALLSTDQPLGRVPWLRASDANGTGGVASDPEPAALHAPAILQYTSGSTSEPRGVVLTQANLLENSEVIARAFGHSSSSRGFIWLPPYHDMGLIGGILQPVYIGFPCVLVSPVAIIKRPARWLEGVSRHRATTSGGPNFAYDLCVRRVDAATRAQLDLSSWDVAFNGAEPVQAVTVDAFVETFGRCGFRREAFLPCYGLAEATLMVTGAPKEAAPTLRRFDAAVLKAARPERPGEEGATTLVGMGHPSPSHEVAIVDPDTATRCEPGALGEIWVSGPSVADGYWRRERETAATFAAQLAGDARPFLRTGDIGVIDGDELFVVGRLKELIIVAGTNYHPHDIERVAEDAHDLLRPHSSAAFALMDGDYEKVALVLDAEVSTQDEAREATAAVRRRVAEGLGLQLDLIVLCPPGSVPKTTSGKIQRRLCRTLLTDGKLEIFSEWRRSEGA
jgi:acyl-CoA synthetase (AMP-forming)/AMP-acid ligase II